MIFLTLNIHAQDMDQLKPYLQKIEDQKQLNEKKKLEEQERQAQLIQTQPSVEDVPAIDVTKVTQISNNANDMNHKKKNTDTEQKYENMYLKDLDGYRKIARSKPYIKNGVVYFSYGQGVPLLICAPKRVCNIQFSKGEEVLNIQIGDSTRWIINVQNSHESSDNISHIFLKPITSGLTTNAIISTDKREYDINLKSSKTGYFSKISFNIPGQEKEKLATVFTDIPKKSKYEYYIRGDSSSWIPKQVLTDGRKTFIELSDKFFHSTDFPTVYSLDSDDTQGQVNKRIYKNWIIVDGMLDRGELVSGVGNHQTKIIFTRKGSFGVLSKLFSKE